jgi:hypothetical protein
MLRAPLVIFSPLIAGGLEHLLIMPRANNMPSEEHEPIKVPSTPFHVHSEHGRFCEPAVIESYRAVIVL